MLRFFSITPSTTDIYTLSLHDALPISFYSKEQYKKVMKKIGIFAAAFVLAAILAVSASAQTRPGTTTAARPAPATASGPVPDRKSTRLNSSHANISYAVFCLKKKKL